MEARGPSPATPLQPFSGVTGPQTGPETKKGPLGSFTKPRGDGKRGRVPRGRLGIGAVLIHGPTSSEMSLRAVAFVSRLSAWPVFSSAERGATLVPFTASAKAVSNRSLPTFATRVL